MKTSYCYNTMRKMGIRLAAGSDLPIESPNVMEAIQVSTTRQNLSGWPEGGWYPEEAFDLLDLSAYADKVSASQFELMKSSVVFNCYIWFQIFHMFNARSVQPGASAFGNILKSRSFFAIMALVAIVQFVMVQFGGAALNTTALPIAIWFKILGLGVTAIVVGEVLRFVQRHLK